MDFFSDPDIQHVFVESRWAGAEFLQDERVTLLRPSVAIPKVTTTRRSNPKRIVLLAVGHGGMVKGLDVVVRLYNTLKKDYPLRLVIAGSFGHNFEYYPEISREAFERANFETVQKELKCDPHVSVRGWRRSSLHSHVYPSADVYLHLSRLETFGYSVLEAMSHGLPVVATRLHAIPEMVHHGVTGWLVDPGTEDLNSTEWCSNVYDGALIATTQLIESSSLRRRFGEAGRRRVTDAYDIEFKRRELARVYERVLTHQLAMPARGEYRHTSS
jgi:glycosyltransferase involved in cell wall biosynthesis